MFTALWKPAERLEASLGVSRQHVAGASLWRGDGWRPQSRGKETTSEAWGRVAWMFAPRWRAQLDIAAATQSGSGRRSRRLSGNVSVTREL